MKKILLLISCLILCITLSIAQSNIEFTKENLKNNKDLKEVYTKFVKKGDKLYYGHERGYLVALEYYLMAYEKHPYSASLNYKIADCYLHTLYKYKALPHALKAQELNPNVAFNIDYIIGLAYHQREDFESAIASYDRFMRLYDGKTHDSLEMARKRVVECGHGKELVKETEYQVVNLGPDINSEYSEYVPLLKADHSYMLFTSRRPINTSSKLTPDNKIIKGERLSKFDMEYHEDIFKSDYLTDSKWSAPCRYDYSTRKNSMHDACVSLSFDGKTIFNYRGDNNGDLYTASIVDGKWTKTVPLKGINTKYREDHIALTHDGKTAYFISDRPGGQGGKDLWKSNLIADNEWSAPENLGPTVNTPYDEEGVFIHPDGKTIYFSSRGHNTMGGFDIFETTFEDGKWSQPLNMGYPTNSPDDDVFFILSSDGKTAYLSSVKEDGYGMQDIYAIKAFEKKKNKKNKTQGQEVKTVNLQGSVKDKDSKEPIKANVEVVDNVTHTVVYTTQVNPGQNFSILVPEIQDDQTYTLNVSSEGYINYSSPFTTDNIKNVEQNISLEKIKVVISNVIILEHIYFDYNEAVIKTESLEELDNAIAYLNSQPSIKIEIEGHTDQSGTAEYNQILSQQRAETVKKYLLSKGFDPKRIVKVTGYGNTRPLVAGNSEEAKSKNRRVEFKLVK